MTRALIGVLALCAALPSCAGASGADIVERVGAAECGWQIVGVVTPDAETQAKGGCARYTPPDGLAVSADNADACSVHGGVYEAPVTATVLVWAPVLSDNKQHVGAPLLVACNGDAG